MKRIHLFALLFLVSLLSIAPARGQVGVYANFSATTLNVPNETGWIYGPTFGIYDDRFHLPVVNFGVDARGEVLGSGGSEQVYGGLVGPRAVFHLPVLPLHPYAEVLGGAARVQVGQGSALRRGTFLNYSVLGGLDLTFFPRLDWRVIEYSYGGFPGLNQGTNQQTVSMGLVFRLPIP